MKIDVDIKIFPPEGIEIPVGKNHLKPKHRQKRQEFFDGLKESILIPGAKNILPKWNLI